MTTERTIQIGVLGDRRDDFEPHQLVQPAFEHAAADLGATVECTWLATPELRGLAAAGLDRFDGFLVSPGSPYRDLEGMLHGIKLVRLSRRPVLGNCAGFQHMVLEFAQNAAGMDEAYSLEYGEQEGTAIIAWSACRLSGQILPITLVSGTLAHQLYGTEQVEERYYCQFALDPAYELPLQQAGLRISGRDPEGLARVIELPARRFYLGTLFVPQARSRPGAPHPVITGFLTRALDGVTQPV